MRKLELDAVYIFFKKYPANNNFDEVSAKLYTLNRCYTLQFERLKVKIEHLAKAIIENGDFDKMIKSADVRVIEFLRNYEDDTNNKKDLFSFATKYAAISSWAIDKDDFMIFDSLNSMMLRFSKKDYLAYLEVIKKNNCNNLSYADFDDLLQEKAKKLRYEQGEKVNEDKKL